MRAFVKSPETASRADVQKLLQQFTAPQDANSIRVELWNAQGASATCLPESETTPLGDLTTEFKQASSEPFKTVGAIRQLKDTIGFPAIAAIKSDDGKVAGYLVRWRKLAASTDTRQQMTRLLGTSATLYLGNHDNDMWTDLANIVAKPAVDVRAKEDILTYNRDGNTDVIGLARPIAGTPWVILIEFPDDVVLKPVSGFMARMLVIGLFLFVMGVAGAFVLSRKITGPLYQLTAGATAISRGDHSRTVDIQQNDEVGQLAKAFNTMVEKCATRSANSNARSRNEQRNSRKPIDSSRQLSANKCSQAQRSREGAHRRARSFAQHGEAVAPVAKARSRRSARRRHLTRLQQPADSDSRLQRHHEAQLAGRPSAATQCRGDRQGQRARRFAHATTAGVQSQAGHATESV